MQSFHAKESLCSGVPGVSIKTPRCVGSPIVYCTQSFAYTYCTVARLQRYTETYMRWSIEATPHTAPFLRKHPVCNVGNKIKIMMQVSEKKVYKNWKKQKHCNLPCLVSVVTQMDEADPRSICHLKISLCSSLFSAGYLFLLPVP